MEEKEYLMQVYKQDKNIRMIEEEIERLTALAEGGAINYGEKVQTSCKASNENLVCKILESKSKLYDLLIDKLKIQDEITDKIYRLRAGKNTNIYQTILLSRYISCMTWEDMSIEIGYTVRRLRQLHGNALEAFRKTVSF